MITECSEISYILIIDDSYDYYELYDLAVELQDTSDWVIDTRDRYYNDERMEICLPDDHSDEMYQGFYYPRRYPSVDLSIEYASMFQDYDSNFWKDEVNTEPDMMSLVGGIYETQEEADADLERIKEFAPKAFVVMASVYIDCMH